MFKRRPIIRLLEPRRLVNAQEWLDHNYPQDQRKEIIKLDVSFKNLTGSLKLVGFNNLIEFNCFENQLTLLDLGDCFSLTELCCSNNRFINLNFLDQINSKLKILYIGNNYFPLNDLRVFSPLFNLEKLWIGSNSWTGSLQPLQTLTKLKYLHVNQTDLTIGLEYLPASLENFYCWETKLAEELEFYGKTGLFGDHIQSLQPWRKANFQLISDQSYKIGQSELATSFEVMEQVSAKQGEVKQTTYIIQSPLTPS